MTSLGSTAAYATGVTAGTLIQNTATASYDGASGPTSVQSNTVTIKVDELLDVAVASLNGSPLPLGPSGTVLTYSVTNSGNGSEAFKLTANPTVTGNTFNATVTGLALDTNGNGTYEPGTDVALTNGAAGPATLPDGTFKVFVIVSLPSGTADNAASQVRLTAEAVTGTGNPGTVFAGQGQGGGDAVVGATHAQGNALGALRASLASVSLVKSYTIVDPFSGTQPVPGATVTYSLRASVAGSGSTSNFHVTDAIPAGTTYKTGSLTLDTVGLTDAADSDTGTGSSSGIDVTLGTVAGGENHTITFKVTIN